MKKKSPLSSPGLSDVAFKALEKRPIVLVLDNVRSGYNVGAAFRISDAFLLEHLYLCGLTPTPPHVQIAKTALGAEKVLPWTSARNVVELIGTLKGKGYSIVAVELVEGAIALQALDIVAIVKPCALVFGHELFGVQEEVLAMADYCVEIPQSGTKFSMNVSVCMGIVTWEFVKPLL